MHPLPCNTGSRGTRATHNTHARRRSHVEESECAQSLCTVRRLVGAGLLRRAERRLWLGELAAADRCFAAAADRRRSDRCDDRSLLRPARRSDRRRPQCAGQGPPRLQAESRRQGRFRLAVLRVQRCPQGGEATGRARARAVGHADQCRGGPVHLLRCRTRERYASARFDPRCRQRDRTDERQYPRGRVAVARGERTGAQCRRSIAGGQDHAAGVADQRPCRLRQDGQLAHRDRAIGRGLACDQPHQRTDQGTVRPDQPAGAERRHRGRPRRRTGSRLCGRGRRGAQACAAQPGVGKRHQPAGGAHPRRRRTDDRAGPQFERGSEWRHAEHGRRGQRVR